MKFTPCSTVRCRYYLMNDGRIYCEGSSGAFNSNFSVMQYSGGTVRFLNGLYTDGDETSFSYYFTPSNQYGDPAQNAGDSKIEEKAANTFINNWNGAVTLPALSLIG